MATFAEAFEGTVGKSAALAGLLLTGLQSPATLFVSDKVGVSDAAVQAYDHASGHRVYPAFFDTIESAYAAAQNGDTVVVLPGEYSPVLTLVEGVTVRCAPDVYLIDPSITADSVAGLRWLGDAVVKVVSATTTAMPFTSCADMEVELDRFEIWRASGGASRSGLWAKRCSGRIKVKSKSFTYDKQYLSIDDEWSGLGNKVILETAENYSLRASGNSTYNDVQPIGIFNGADVDWLCKGEQHSDFNNCITFGAITNPAEAMTTRVRMFADGVVFSPATGTVLVRGDTTASGNEFALNVFEIHGTSRHQGSEFSRHGGTNATQNTLKIFGQVFAKSDTSAFGTVTGNTITVTADA